jgi:hypothetical protein
MRIAMIKAARILVVCLLCGVAARQPARAQLQPGTHDPGSQDSTADDAGTQQPAAQPPATQQQQTATPPAAPQPSTPATPAPVVTSAPPFYAGDGVSVTLQYWLGTGHPNMGTGHGNGNGVPSALDYMGKPRPGLGGVVSIPVGKHNAIRMSYFRVQGNGNPTATQNLNIYGVPYSTGNYLAVHYDMQNVKLSLDYLSWPFPVKDSKFHIKTLWEVQYTTITSSVDAPLLHGETDASGAPVNVNGYGSDWFIFPSFGLGVDYLISQRLRFEGRASGFAFPHRATVWDTEATLDYRFGKFELQGGLKAFHFKTSPLKVEFVEATFPGAYVGLRWYPEYGRR